VRRSCTTRRAPAAPASASEQREEAARPPEVGGACNRQGAPRRSERRGVCYGLYNPPRCTQIGCGEASGLLTTRPRLQFVHRTTRRYRQCARDNSVHAHRARVRARVSCSLVSVLGPTGGAERAPRRPCCVPPPGWRGTSRVDASSVAGFWGRTPPDYGRLTRSTVVEPCRSTVKNKLFFAAPAARSGVHS
jgi:hypothetical protein